jgi:hypothetical protein
MVSRVDGATEVLCTWLDEEVELVGWCRSNPEVYIGLSPDGRRHVCKEVEAWERVLDIRAARDNGHRDFLLGLLDDLPPKPPHEHPYEHIDLSKERAEGALAFYFRACIVAIILY